MRLHKNRHTYDVDGNQLTAGETITGWFSCDFNMSQIDWAENEADSDSSIIEKTAEVIFAEKDSELGSLKITKSVTYNGKTPSANAQKQKLAGTYTFKIYTDEACRTTWKVTNASNEQVDKTVSITITADGDTSVTSEEVTDLPPGDYWIKEDTPSNGASPLVNPVKVTVQAGKTGENAAVANVTNNYSEGPDELSLSVRKTFSGIENTQIPQNFTLTVTVAGQSYTLTKTPAEGIAFTESADGMTWIWTIQNVPAGSTYQISETNNQVDGYTVSPIGTGDSIQIEAASLFPENVNVNTSPFESGSEEGTYVWQLSKNGQNRLFLAQLSDGSVLVVSDNALTMSERKAVENLLSANAAFSGWSGTMKYFSVDKHPDGFQTGNLTASYSQDNSAVLFTKTNTEGADPWQSYASVDINSAANTADLSVTNLYTRVPINLDIIKVDHDDTAVKLAGAVFTLQEIADEAPARGGTMTPMEGASLITSAETSAGTGLTTFTGLSQGYYELKELTPPDGYILGEGITVYFKVYNGDVIWLEKGEGAPSTWSAKELTGSGAEAGTDDPMITFTAAVEANPQTQVEASNARFTIGNEPGAELPHTGGSGTHLPVLWGGILIFAAGLLLWIRRMNKA